MEPRAFCRHAGLEPACAKPERRFGEGTPASISSKNRLSGAGDRVEVLVTLIEAYEARHFTIAAPDPIAAIEFMMEQKGLGRRDLEPSIGSRGRVSEVLTRKRPLTLPMVRRLNALLDIPIAVLAQPDETRSAA